MLFLKHLQPLNLGLPPGSAYAGLPHWQTLLRSHASKSGSALPPSPGHTKAANPACGGTSRPPRPSPHPQLLTRLRNRRLLSTPVRLAVTRLRQQQGTVQLSSPSGQETNSPHSQPARRKCPGSSSRRPTLATTKGRDCSESGEGEPNGRSGAL